MSRASQGTVGHSDIAESYRDGLVKVGPGEKMGYQYDRAGNMIAKGNHYSSSGGRIQYTAKSVEMSNTGSMATMREIV